MDWLQPPPGFRTVKSAAVVGLASVHRMAAVVAAEALHHRHEAAMLHCLSLVREFEPRWTEQSPGLPTGQRLGRQRGPTKVQRLLGGSAQVRSR